MIQYRDKFEVVNVFHRICITTLKFLFCITSVFRMGDCSNFSVNSHKKKAAARVFIDVDLMRHISKRDTDVEGIKVTDTTEHDTQRSPSRNGNDKNWGLFNHFFRSTSDPECTDGNRMNRNGLENTKRGSVVRRIFSSRKVSGRASAIMKSVSRCDQYSFMYWWFSCLWRKSQVGELLICFEYMNIGARS